MPLGDILKRQAKLFFSGDPHTRRNQPSLEEELREEFRATLDPGREQREAAERAAHLEEARRQPGTGQPVEIDGYRGRWEVVELALGEADTATFILVDRETGEDGQLGAMDDGSVVLDMPDDQFSGRAAGAFWHDGSSVGIRLSGAELKSDQRRVRVTCDLRAAL
jgi:hypothetical protein